MKYRTHGLFGRASSRASHSRDADSERRFAPVPDAFGERRCYFSAYGAVTLDHLLRNSREFGLQIVRVDHGSSQEITRASRDGGDALGQQSTGAGFGNSESCIPHLQPVSDDLLERLAVS